MNKLQGLFSRQILSKGQECIDILKDQPENQTYINVLRMFFEIIYDTGAEAGFGKLVEPAGRIKDKLSLLAKNEGAVPAELLKETESALNVLEGGLELIKELKASRLPGEWQQPPLQKPKHEILIIDDDSVVRKIVISELSKRNFCVIEARSADEAKEILGRHLPDLILLDIIMPGQSGLELIREFREDRRLKWIPILFLTVKSCREDIEEGIKTGADDYITKPFDTEDLATRISAKIARFRELHDMAIRDPLTGTFSREYFTERIIEEVEVSLRKNTVFSIVIFDLDFFKDVNDGYGHQAGDIVLQKFASFLEQKFRQTDTICRYGGEEFIVLMPGVGSEVASAILERLKNEWDETALFEPYQNRPLNITFSAGISEFGRDGKTYQEIIKSADNALYLAKETGRNKIVAASE